jgi:hypothetical protein
MPDEIKKLINLALYDLDSGPTYYSDETYEEELTCFDKDAVPFNFSKAVKEISAWVDDDMPSPLYMPVWSGYIETRLDDDLGFGEYYEWSRSEIARIVFGKELASYL